MVTCKLHISIVGEIAPALAFKLYFNYIREEILQNSNSFSISHLIWQMLLFSLITVTWQDPIVLYVEG